MSPATPPGELPLYSDNPTGPRAPPALTSAPASAPSPPAPYLITSPPPSPVFLTNFASIYATAAYILAILASKATAFNAASPLAPHRLAPLYLYAFSQLFAFGVLLFRGHLGRAYKFFAGAAAVLSVPAWAATVWQFAASDRGLAPFAALIAASAGSPTSIAGLWAHLPAPAADDERVAQATALCQGAAIFFLASLLVPYPTLGVSFRLTLLTTHVAVLGLAAATGSWAALALHRRSVLPAWPYRALAALGTAAAVVALVLALVSSSVSAATHKALGTIPPFTPGAFLLPLLAFFWSLESSGSQAVLAFRDAWKPDWAARVPRDAPLSGAAALFVPVASAVLQVVCMVPETVIFARIILELVCSGEHPARDLVHASAVAAAAIYAHPRQMCYLAHRVDQLLGYWDGDRRDTPDAGADTYLDAAYPQDKKEVV